MNDKIDWLKKHPTAKDVMRWILSGIALNWISVDDKLPDENGDYLVFGKSYLGSCIYHCDYFDTKYQDWYKYPHGQVTHWMLLPDPPDREDGEE